MDKKELVFYAFQIIQDFLMEKYRRVFENYGQLQIGMPEDNSISRFVMDLNNKVGIAITEPGWTGCYEGDFKLQMMLQSRTI